jgi:hypothetical protein
MYTNKNGFGISTDSNIDAHIEKGTIYVSNKIINEAYDII